LKKKALLKKQWLHFKRNLLHFNKKKARNTPLNPAHSDYSPTLSAMRYILFFLLLFLEQTRGVAQSPAAFNVTLFNESNGISNGRVTTMLQGKNGYLWIGTTNGLLCYDSYSFRQYNNPAILNAITRLVEDSHHIIWMSFQGGGFASFNPATGVFKNYMVQNPKDTSLVTAEIEMLFFDKKGQLWIGVNQKGWIKADLDKNVFTIYDIVPEQDTFYTPAFRRFYNNVLDAYEDESGLLWLATQNGLYQFNPKTELMAAVRAKPLQKDAKRFDCFGRIIADKDSFWLSAWGGGISSYNKKTNEWHTYLPSTGQKQGFVSDIILYIANINERELLVINPDKGLGVFNKRTKTFYFFSTDKKYSNLQGAEWGYTIIDKEGNIWAKNSDGLVKIQEPNYKFSFTPVKAKSSIGSKFYIEDMLEEGHQQLILTNFADGVHIWDKKTNKKTILPIGELPNEEKGMIGRHLLKDKSGTIWVITRDIIYQYDNRQNKLIKINQPPTYTVDKPSNSFSHAAEDNEGNIWFTTRRNGVFVYNIKTKNYTHYSNTADTDHFINATYLASAAMDVKGRMWLAGNYGFLGYTDPITKKITQINSGDGKIVNLPSTHATSLLADSKGDIWVGTYYGLCYIDCHAAAPSVKKVFRARDGLRSDLIANIQEDNEGYIWCVTSAAICRINPLDNRIIGYDARDGLTKGIDGGIAKTPSDTLRIFTINGYYNVNTHDLTCKTTMPPLMITRMTVNDKEFYYKEILSKEGKITLKASENVFSFDFAAIDFSRSDKQLYSYQLEGFDKEWIDAENRRFVTYTNIPGGNYTFKIRIYTDGTSRTPSAWWEGGAIDDNSIQIPLFIETPFYKTSLFYLLITVLASGLVYWLYRNRINHHTEIHDLQSKTQLLEKEKALVMFEGLKQQLNPHFLFNSLTSLSGLIQTDQKMAGNFLEQMSKIYRYILKNREHTTVSVYEEIKFVNNYVQLQKTRFKQGLEVNITVHEDSYYRKIAPVTLQNLVENALKHNIMDTESPLVINIFCDEDYLIVQNNLQKKTFVETSNHQGLSNMQSLYKYLTAKPIIIEEKDNKFIVKIPLL
jgi:ligand-binding sensor domain-containing protein